MDFYIVDSARIIHRTIPPEQFSVNLATSSSESHELAPLDGVPK
jgi:hypothetical protein